MQAFKSNRLFSYECLGQTKLGDGQGGHKSKICRYDFHLKAYFLKKWNFCSPGVLERLEKLKKHRISSQKKFQKSWKIFFRKIAPYQLWWVWDGIWACSGSGSISQTIQNHYQMISKKFWKSIFRLENSIFFQNFQKFIRKTWFLRVFKSNRLFSWQCLGQTKLGEGQGGHK